MSKHVFQLVLVFEANTWRGLLSHTGEWILSHHVTTSAYLFHLENTSQKEREKEREREEILCVWVNVWCITERDSKRVRERRNVFTREIQTDINVIINSLLTSFLSTLYFSQIFWFHILSIFLSIFNPSLPFFWVFLCSYLFSTFICFYTST